MWIYCKMQFIPVINLLHSSVSHDQARAEGGAEGAWAPAPLPKVPFCQGIFIFFIFY